ncbi:MAG: hypothetical protein ACO1Q7_07505 [Gemmatimonas sp.]
MRVSTRRPLFAAMAVAMMVSVAACDDGLPADPINPPTPAAVVGKYNLLKVDSAPLPYVIFQHSTYIVSLMSANVELRANGTYRAPVSIRIDDSGNVRYLSDSTTGIWTLTGDSIKLANANGQVTRAGRMLNGTFRLRSAEQLWELRK